MNYERFTVTYQILDNEANARERVRIICFEQTVEVWEELVPDGFIRDHILGQLVNFSNINKNCYQAEISYAIETTAFELTQFLNVLFGNSSIKTGIRVTNIDFNSQLLNQFSGPRFGTKGLRDLVNVYDQPLLSTALKPMGKLPQELAALAYQFALGGVDIIKDDHGLTNQSFCPFEERVQACAEAVAQANQQTGKHCIYVPNISAPAHEIQRRVNYAQKMGVGGLLIAPGLVGFDTIRMLAKDDTVNLPLIGHPAFLGSMVVNQSSGIEQGVLFGQLHRLAGADATIYPNYGGRFGFGQTECQSIAYHCQTPLGNYPAILPMPGGGMTADNIPDMLDLYGHDVIFLIGGALYTHSPNLVDNVHHFLKLIGRLT